jgi:hypothetical protein
VYGNVMGNTLTLESLIGVFAAMVVVVALRRKTNRVIELAVWIGLIWVCVLAITHAGNPRTLALTRAALWGAGQIVGMILGVFGQDVLQWMSTARFAIADWVVLLCGVDLLVLALVSTNRQASAPLPGTRLREWIVLPRLRAAETVPEVVPAAGEINRRFKAWPGPVAAASAMWATLFFIWLRDAGIPGEAQRWRNIALLAGGARRPVAAVPAQLDPHVVDITVLAERVDARKAEAVSRPAEAAATTPKRRRRAAPKSQTNPRTDNNGSEQHQQGRLAS